MNTPLRKEEAGAEAQSLPAWHGFLLLDKPLGMSSAQAVGQVKRALPRKTKIGHAGTLDPLASGLLPLAVGEATKAIRFLMDASKTYAFTLCFGEDRTTMDAEGEVTTRCDARPDLAAIHAVLPQFSGEIMQTPPAYSAIKVNGKRAYALAREGEAVELKPRPVTIHALSCDGYDGQEAHFTVACGKGTYVRSLAQDIAHALGACGYVSALRRTKVGKFDVTDAFLLEKQGENVHSAALLAGLMPIERVLDDIPAHSINAETARRIRHGQPVTLPGMTPETDENLLCVLEGGVLVAIGEIAQDQRFRPSRVFNHHAGNAS